MAFESDLGQSGRMASVDQTEARNGNTGFRDRRLPRRNLKGA
jgi:hypothetical protein